jgi:release factor glutamine methyltransferase
VISDAAETLAQVSDTPSLDAIVLIAHATRQKKATLLASYPDPVPEHLLDAVSSCIEQRLSGTPVAYITGVKEFFGREFWVDKRVLIPRPDTEILIEAALQHGPYERILDVGTGSGCIAVTLAAEIPGSEVVAIDLSEDAIEVCKINASELLSRRIEILSSDLFENVPGRFDCIVSNPPYLTDIEWRDTYGLTWDEPAIALRAGPAGMEVYKRLIRSCVDYIRPNGYLFLEASPDQIGEIVSLCADSGFCESNVYRDLAGNQRVVGVRYGSFTLTTRI